MRVAVVVAAGLGCVLASSHACAESQEAAPPTREVAQAPPARINRFYGWQIVIVDVSSLLVTVAGGAAASDGVAALGVTGYVLGGPIVHFAHGNVGRGFGSLGLRVGAPILGAGIGAASANCHGGDFCGMREAVVGGLVGAAVAVVLDAAVLARDEVNGKPITGANWYPELQLSRDGESRFSA